MSTDIKQWLQSHKFQLTTAAGLLILSVGGYMIYRSLFHTHKPKQGQRQQTHLSTSQSERYKLGLITRQGDWFDQRYREVIQTIKVHFDGQHLNVEAIKSICKGQYTLAEKDYKVLVGRSRVERRVVIYDDKEQYATLVLKAEVELEMLLQKHLNAILARFNIPKDFWMGEIGAWVTSSQQASQQWESIIQQSQNCLLDTLRQSDQLFPQVKKILEFKLQTINNLNPQQPSCPLSLHCTSDESSKFTLIDKFLSDVAWKQFKIQEEDLNFSLRHLKGSQKEEADQILERIVERTRVLIYGQGKGMEEENDEQDKGQSQNEDYY